MHHARRLDQGRHLLTQVCNLNQRRKLAHASRVAHHLSLNRSGCSLYKLAVTQRRRGIWRTSTAISTVFGTSSTRPHTLGVS